MTPALSITPDVLLAIAGSVSRLCPDSRRPERFHEEKSEVADQLRRLARELERTR